MSDTVKSWIEERRAIHAAAESPWWTTRDLQPATVFAGDGSAEDIAVLTTFEHIDAAAIVDAHNTFPRALDALSAVLELHKPFEWSFGYEPIKSCRACAGFGAAQDNAEWPCATVQAIEGAINNE